MPSYTIGGCKVHFPHQAYGVQLSFMSKVIAALEGGHNALLEAPTGSGKTLSLLCSALAWQVREKLRIEEGLAAERAAADAAKAAGLDGIADADAADCCGGGGCGSGASPDAHQQQPLGDGGFLAPEEGGAPEAAPQRRKPPKIFYATRTHSQIAQVVKELKRSQFSPRMAVLGSRKHYCVNAHAARQGSIDEACEELMKESKCQYFKNVHSFVSSGYQNRLHDIEDLKGFGKAHKACPYYTARKWAEEAEVIFCPYSYLLDPVIRRAMAVDVEGSLLVFDEAHNIEDVCREAASMDVDLDTVTEVLMALKKAVELNGKPEVYAPLAACADALQRWMREREQVAAAAMRQQAQGGQGRGGYQAARFQEPYEKLVPAKDMLRELSAMGLGADQVDPLWDAYTAAREEEEAMAQSDGGPPRDGKENKAQGGAGAPGGGQRVGSLALGFMSRLIQVVRMLHQVSDDGPRDYRLVVNRFYEREPGKDGGRYKSRRGGGGSEDGDDAFLPGYQFKMCLWAMNPAVAFKTVAAAAHSVVLTSGTLAPLEGFASELGTPFNITLEAPHVVDMRRQVWAGVVGTGPGGVQLQATYKHQGDASFQDGVGRVVADAAAAIPDGLLVFLPSYSLLDKLLARWKSTGLLAQLGALKKIVQEPRGGGQEGLKKAMQEYYAAIQKGGGAIFFAVCRGKVSEGLDFADGNARGVIIVGIPFPAARDLKVTQKKEFNDRGQRSLGLVSGDTWYSQQAFRALNQALGRCIRHRLDWGAILMVDERFKQPRNQRMLSRWVRGALAVHPSFEAGMHSMRAFFKGIQANPPGPPPGAAPANPAEAEMAAAVAAAVARAGPLPQPEVKAEPAQAGRGAEGALGGAWGPKPQPNAAGMLTLYDMWQGRPLAQAQQAALPAAGQGPGSTDCGGDGGSGAVKQEPIHLPPHAQQQQHHQPQAVVKDEEQQWQQWGQPPPPQQQWGQPPPPQQQWQQPLPPQQQWGQYPPPQQQCEQPPPPQQQCEQPPPPQQQWGQPPPPQQQWGQPPPSQQQWDSAADQHQPVPGFYARPPSAATVQQQQQWTEAQAQQLQALLAQAPVAAWATADARDSLAFLQSLGLQGPPPGYTSLLAAAVDGVRDAFLAASEYMQQQRPLHHLAGEWRCALPRALQAMMGASPAAFPDGRPWDPAACEFGQRHLRAAIRSPQHLLAALKAAYKAPLAAVLADGGSRLGHEPGLLPMPREPVQLAVPSAGKPAAGAPASTRGQQQQQGDGIATPPMEWTKEQQARQQQAQPGGPQGGSWELTAGAAAHLHAGLSGGTPVMQVIGIKPLAGSDGQRFRLLLSDGQHMHPVLLTGAPGALAAGGGLVSGSLVRLLGYQTSLVQGHKVVIVVELEVLQREAAICGRPVLYAKALAAESQGGGGGGGVAPAPPAAQPPVSAPAQQPWQQQHEQQQQCQAPPPQMQWHQVPPPQQPMYLAPPPMLHQQQQWQQPDPPQQVQQPWQQQAHYGPPAVVAHQPPAQQHRPAQPQQHPPAQQAAPGGKRPAAPAAEGGARKRYLRGEKAAAAEASRKAAAGSRAGSAAEALAEAQRAAVAAELASSGDDDFV